MKIFFSCLFLFFPSICNTLAIAAEVFSIDNVSNDSVEASLESDEKPASSYLLLEIYDVYEKLEEIAGKKVYTGFIDSVYLKRVEKAGEGSGGKLLFAYVWEGESKYLKTGYLLVPTGRKYAAPMESARNADAS